MYFALKFMSVVVGQYFRSWISFALICSSVCDDALLEVVYNGICCEISLAWLENDRLHSRYNALRSSVQRHLLAGLADAITLIQWPLQYSRLFMGTCKLIGYIEVHLTHTVARSSTHLTGRLSVVAVRA